MLRLTEQKLRSLIKSIILEATAPNPNTWGQNFIKNIKLEKPELLQDYRIIFNKEHTAFFLNYNALYKSETGLGNTENGEMNEFTADMGQNIVNFFDGWLEVNPKGDIPYWEDDEVGFDLGEFMVEGLHGEGVEIFQIEIRNINTGKNILTAYDYSDTEVDYGDEDEGEGGVMMSSSPTIYRPNDEDLLADENIDFEDKRILKNLAIIKVIRWYLSNEWQSYSAGQTPDDVASNYNIPYGSTSDADWAAKFKTTSTPTTPPLPTPATTPTPTTPKLSAAEKALKKKAKEAEIYSQWDLQNQSLNDKYFKKPTPTKPKK